MTFSCIRLLLLAVLLWPVVAAGETGVTDDIEFRSVNDIVSALNPLDVIANHGGVRRSIDLNIQFALNSAQLLPAAKIQVDALAQALLSHRLDGYNISIIGHTDASGSTQANAALSARRAQAVMNSITADYGVSATRLSFEGKGETGLINGLAPTDPRNRRVEIVAVAQDGQAPGGTMDGETLETDEEGEKSINW